MTEIASEVPKDLLSISTAYVSLPQDKRRLFRERLKARGIDAARLPIVPFPEAAKRLPLSHAQERLWFLWRLDPASAAYNVTGAVRLRGPLAHDVLRAALDRVVDAHESLRLRFEEADGVPFQCVGPRAYGWEVLAPDVARNDAAALDTLLAQRSAQPFDLERGPLLRVTLIALGEDDHVLHVALHHIVADGLSLEVFVAEFAQAYRACVAGEAETHLPALQFGDYARWQREWFDDTALAAQLDYWRTRLGSEHPVLELPRAQQRPGMRSGAGARVARVLPAACAAALERAALAAGATPFMILLAAYDLLLARYSGQHDIRVGLPVAGRGRPEIERTIGFFVNTLVIRAELDQAADFPALLAQVRTRVLEAQAHADLPFSTLVDTLQPQRGLGHTPLFQAMFNYLGKAGEPPALPDIEVSNHALDVRTARFDLVLEAREGAHGVELALVYAVDVFDGAMIERMLGHYVRLLEQIAAEPGRALGAFELDDAALGAAQPACRAFVPVSRRWAASAARHAQAFAVHCEGERITYGELDAWAARIARRLRQAGVADDERVGICVTRSAGMVAALLGVLRSRGAFVPLDPAYPAERLTWMMDDARVRVVLTDTTTLAQCGALLAGRTALAVDALETQEGSQDAASASDVARDAEPHPEQLAYVIYTSGSTGLPKGVAISHGAFAAHLGDFIEAHGISARDTVLQSSTINFDVALHELLPALLCGGKVEMRGAEPWDIETTSRHLSEARVSFARLPTAYWQQWLRSPPPPAALGALRQITVGGEGLPGDALAQWRDGPLGHIALANLYGPTETTVACLYRATTAEDVRQPIVSIGTPYASRTARILDRHGNEAPAGVSGELCIGGGTLARGYLDRPSLTAERFVPDPARPGARLYRTGDLCRRASDGSIDFLGRLDQQIKLRGFRIEPGEIEAALRRQPGIADAVVTLARDLGAPRLVAHVVPHAGAAVDPEALRRVLAQQLPAHMVPAACGVLERLPTLPNGKVDRAALPAVDAVDAVRRTAPRNEAERILLAWWEAVLGRADLGIDDDFFAVGGDSILSLQLIARARAQGWLLTPRQIFEQQSIARLAAVMRPLGETAVLAERHDAVPLTPVQAGFFERFPDGEPHWNQSVLLAVRGALDTEVLERALHLLVARHDALRLCFSRHPDGWTQRVLPDVPQALLSAVDLRGYAQTSAAGRAEAWTAALARHGQRVQQSLDPRAGRLVHALYASIPAETGGVPSGRLLLAVHHLAVDGVSWRILLDDLQALYAALSAGSAPQLGAVPVPWSVWAVRQREAISDARLARALPAWQAHLRGAVSVLDAPRVTSEASRTHAWTLDAAATAALRDAAPRAYRLGIDELLLTALTRAYSGCFGTSGLLIGLEGHGRQTQAVGNDTDLSRTVGWFTARYPAWLEAFDDPARALLSVKARVRGLPDHGMSWGWLRAYGTAEMRAALAELPVPRVSFNYLGQFDQTLPAQGLFDFASEAAGEPQPGNEPLAYTLDLNGMLVDGRLRFAWQFDPSVLAPESVERLIIAFEREVRCLVEHCARAEPRASAADFPLAGLSEEAFERLGFAAADIEDLYPATPLQEGLLFHSWMEPGAYVNRKRLTLHGTLDIEAMRAAWRTVVKRHPILRTRFVRTQSRGTLQAVQASVPDIFSVHDWHARDDYEDAFSRWFETEAPGLIDLDRAPLMHVAVFVRPDGAHDLVWINHHALSDGWSQAQLLGELVRVYGAARRGEAASLAPAVPYRAYLEWLSAQPDTEPWWRAQLARADRPALLADGLAGQTAATRVASFRHRAQRLDAELSAALARAAQQHGVTLNTVMQAAWALLLARRGNRRQAAFGITVAGRPADLPDAAAIQGLFINSLPLWVDVPADRPLGEWLRALQSYNLELRQAEHAPLASIQRWAGPHFGPLFDSLLVFENYPVDAALGDASLGLSVTHAASFERTHYALTLGVVPGERIGLEWSWDAARVDDAAIEGLTQAYLDLLAGCAGQDAGSLSSIRAPGRPAECGAASCAETLHVYRSVVDRIEAAARAWPDALAVHCEGASLSYGELDAWAGRIARELSASGVRDDARVGVCVARSPVLIAALLGVLKAGGAYVPLDPAYPVQRLREMIDDARPAALLTDAGTQARHRDLLQATGCRAVRADLLRVAPTAAWQGRPARAAQLAYVIYTSGSTGRPKGVAMTHGALSQHLDDFIGDNGLSRDDCVLQFTTVNFDTSVEQIFASLAVGAALEMRGPSVWTAGQLTRVLSEQRVTVADFPSGYWRQWLRELRAPLPAFALRRVMIAGEALPGSAVAQWFDAPLAHVPLVNNYGPTETAITASAQPVTRAHAAYAAAPIGRPRASRIYRILDLDGAPVPRDGIGELCIGGAALARGYWGRPGQTAERFVPDPDGAPGARLYRTGDLCRWLPDGSVAYLGRLDHQVKLRGFRIELGEIESVLCAQPGIAEALAVVHGAADARRLHAYVVAVRGSARPDSTVLRDALARALPAYMVPAAIVVLDALPTLPNGKLDRHALPVPEAVARRYVAPATRHETLLAEIWQAVLGGDAVSAEDDFFMLGGDSLLALQVAARAQRAIGCEVPLRTLFEHPGLASQAAALERLSAGSRAPLRRLGRCEVRPAHGQERLWFLWRLAPDHAAYHLSLSAHLDGPLDPAALHAAFDAVTARHEMLHARFDERDGVPWLVVDASLRGEWSEAVFTDREAPALAAWLGAAAARPFDLARGPLLRAQLAGLADGSHVFGLTVHHIAADGWSLNLLIDEMLSAYADCAAGRTPAFAPLPIQYTDYVQWQHDTCDAAQLARQLDYWRARLGTDHPVLELPADRPRPTQRDGRGAQVEITLAPELSDALQAFARRREATLFMTLLAAFHALLHRYSGQHDIRIGIPLSGRERLEAEALIGFFVNTAVIRADLSGSMPFDRLLDQVKQSVLDARANQDVPFAQIVDALQPVRAQNQTPLFQVMFNFDVQADTARRHTGAGLRMTPLGGQRHAAQFDLALGVSVADRVSVSLGYALDLFERETAERLLADYAGLLAQLVSGDALRLRDFELHARPLVQCGTTPAAPREFAPVHLRIAERARLRPEAVAVRGNGVSLTYGELEARAARLARYLRRRGVAREALVGVCLSRTPEMLVALLAVMKAGAAYVPLDPAYPAAHLLGMAEDARLACVLADETGRRALGDTGAGVLIDIERACAPDARASGKESEVPVLAEQLAYVIYTSGSTGKPKGVAVSHGALARFLDSMQTRLALTEDDIWLAVTTLSFDIAALELYLPLLAGATIELAPRETVVDGPRLAKLAETACATVMQATPMGWRVLLDGGWRGPDSRTHRFAALCGGEALPRDLADALCARGVTLWNLYGPTETTIWSSAARLAHAQAPITLGEPLEHTALSVCDADGNAVPVNGIGELCIGGANLARGYLRRAGLSAERFVPDPHGLPGARLYRTGDLCRVRGDGRLDFIGRADQQVKLRGFRIELGETEAALRACAGVTGAACRIQGEGAERRLVAFYTGDAEPDVLRAELTSRLPVQQVPAQLAWLDALPLTSNGKLDRKALPWLEASTRTVYAPPVTATQTLLCGVWADVLGVAQVGIEDDFFMLGGHSLLAVRVAARVGEALGRKVEVAEIFRHPRLGDLAERLDAAVPAAATPGAPGTLDALRDLLDAF